MKRITIINGPNLNRQGQRQTAVYGEETFESLMSALRFEFTDIDFELFQSNCEGEIIDRVQQCSDSPDQMGIILNAGAYSHYSYAIADAVADAAVPVVEVHISNIYARETFRNRSVISPFAKAVIAGAGMHGYLLAASFIKNSSFKK